MPSEHNLLTVGYANYKYVWGIDIFDDSWLMVNRSIFDTQYYHFVILEKEE